MKQNYQYRSIAFIGFVICLGVAGIKAESYRAEETKAVMNSYANLYPEMIVEKKTVYLTFDDGPSEVTREVLKILEGEGVKATFFVVGKNITEEKEELIKQIKESGNSLGIHTYSHEKQKIYSSVESYLEDFHETYTRIVEITNEAPNIFRFPWGSANPYVSSEVKKTIIEEMQRRGFDYYDWNVSAEDSVGNPSEWEILHNVLDDFTKYEEAVVLLHDSSINEKTAKVLPKMIQTMKEAGYEFDVLSHMKEPYQY